MNSAVAINQTFRPRRDSVHYVEQEINEIASCHCGYSSDLTNVRRHIFSSLPRKKASEAFQPHAHCRNCLHVWADHNWMIDKMKKPNTACDIPGCLCLKFEEV